MNTPVAFSLLADGDRQDVLRALLVADGTCTVDELTEAILADGVDPAALERAEVELVHRHLPQLEAHDVVEWDGNVIECTATAERLGTLLEYADEL